MGDKRAMAKETKVGLVVGLAFIICFAVILANRGRRTPLATHVAYNVDSGNTVGREAAASGMTSSLPRRSEPARRRDEPSGARQVRLASRSDAEMIPGQDLVPGPVPGRRITPTNGARVTLPAAITTSNQAPKPSVLTSASQARQARRQQLQEYLDAQNKAPAVVALPVTPAIRQVPAKVEKPTKPPASPPARGERYTVVAGDTLSRIAGRQYGTRTVAAVKAIFEANRSTLSSPDVVRVGMVLTLPDIKGVGTPKRAGSGLADKATASKAAEPKSSKSPKSSWRWYQIKKNDRYSSIAKRELGATNRWREIFELNRDKFPDPERIREGVRIKLPIVSLAAAVGKRR